MTTSHFNELSPEEPQDRDARLASIVEYWTGIWECEDSGGTTWDVLEELERQVTDCLARHRAEGRRSYLEAAEWLTAKAEFLRAGGHL